MINDLWTDQIDGYRVPECWNGRSFLAVLPSAE
jgi:hypothetical protein